MCGRTLSVVIGILSVGGLVFLPMGCDGLDSLILPFDAGSDLSAETTLTSTSLSGVSDAAQDGPEEVVGISITPTNVTGEVLSLLFATAGQEDEGLVVFGDSRPDIAPADSDLIEFDLANPQPIISSIGLKPGFVGGQSEHMVLLFGFMDMHFTLGGTPKVVRVALADVDGMVRGDKLLEDATTGEFQWYDLDASAFTSTRPTNPATIEAIRDFTDPIRPNLVFYPINAFLFDPVELDAAALGAASAVTVTLDFFMTHAIKLVEQTDVSAVTDDVLVTSFDLVQNTSGFGDSGFQVDGTLNLLSIELNPNLTP